VRTLASFTKRQEEEGSRQEGVRVGKGHKMMDLKRLIKVQMNKASKKRQERKVQIFEDGGTSQVEPSS